MPDNRGITYVESGGLVVYRASALGGCLAALVASRLGYHPVPHTQQTLDAFKKGNDAEPIILDHLREKGWKIVDEQKEVEVRVSPTIVVRGHIDAIGTPPDEPTQQVLIECKYMGQSSYNSWRRDRLNSFPRYAWQTSAYLHALGLGQCVIAILPEKTGTSDPGVVVSERFAPVHTRGEIRKRVLAAERCVKNEALPVCDSDYMYGCPFYYLHEQKQLPLLDTAVDSLVSRILYHSGEITKQKTKVEELKVKLRKWLEDHQTKTMVATDGRVSIVNQTSYDYTKMIEDFKIDRSKYAKTGSSYVRVAQHKEREEDAES